MLGQRMMASVGVRRTDPAVQITDIDQDAVAAVVEGPAAVADTGWDVSGPAGVDQSYAEFVGEHGHHNSGQMLPLDDDPKSAT
ncbi:MAG TPA: hypothetical protein VGH76_05645 [Actinomycetospora sp.]|jgi:hypothetical protein|uniref:hypothetical protein n=1 Tax=Actinomycetospora sp. TaxID=1872135 RepID=UPI002F3E930C